MSPCLFFLADCEAGQALSPSDDTQCIVCSVGTYKDSTGPQNCTTCPVGQTIFTTGSSSSSACIGECYRNWCVFYMASSSLNVS